jgi:hypothetical protein
MENLSESEEENKRLKEKVQEAEAIMSDLQEASHMSSHFFIVISLLTFPTFFATEMFRWRSM